MRNQNYVVETNRKIYTDIMQMIYHDEVKAFVKKLQKPTQSKVLRGIELLEQYGWNLSMPHTKKISNFLYELRIRGTQDVRIIYVLQEDSAILLHCFLKKTQKTPRREIETAEKRFRLLT